MSHILFGESYYLRFDPKLWQAMQPYPPLGTMYAASYMRDRGYDVALFDAMLATSESGWEAMLEHERPRIAVLFEDNFNYLSKMCLGRMRQAAFTMIGAALSRGCTVIVCGSDATDHADEYIAHGAHYVLLGEGEETLAELVDRLEGRTSTSLSSIRGLAYRSEGGSVTRNPRRPDIRELDALPFPAWDLVDVERYRAAWLAHHGYFSMNMATTRGCPYHCNWCAKPIWGQRYNSRSPENVVAELKWLKDTYQPDHVSFADDIMGLKPRWIDRFAELVEEHDARVPFKSLHRADLLLRGDTIEALGRAGAKTVWIGAESGAQEMLDRMEKGTRVEQIYEAARRLQMAGIEVGFFLQFGYPGEGRAEIRKTFRMVRECMPNDIGVSVSYPLPGTGFHEAVRRQLGLKQNWTDSSDLAMLYRGPFSTGFYRQLHRVIHKEFRARKSWASLRSDLRRSALPPRSSFRRAASLGYYLATLPWERARLEWLALTSPRGQRVELPGRARPASHPTPQAE